MGSSFDRINQSFLGTAEWKDLNAKFRETMRTATISRWEFSRSRNYQTGMDEVTPSFVLTFGGVEVSRSPEGVGDSFCFPSGDALEDGALNRVAEVNFGTRACPTYNCKKEKLLKKWPEFARKKLVDSNMDVVGEMERRVKLQAREILASPEFSADKQRFYERGVIDEIRKVVLKYYGKVTPEVLKEALDEVVAHAIMES